MARKSLRCAFLTHKRVFTFAFPTGVLFLDIDGAIGFVETSEQNSEPRNEAGVHDKKEGERERPPSSFLEWNVVVTRIIFANMLNFNGTRRYQFGKSFCLVV